MLVLSRKENDKVLFPHLGIAVQVLSLAGNKVRLGIDAPKDVKILRNELSLDKASRLVSQKGLNQEVGNRLRARLRTAALDLCALHEELESSTFDDAEPAIFRVFSELKSIDEDVAKACGLETRTSDSLGKRKRALLVEDNENEAKLLAGFLRCRDIEVDIAKNGASALGYLSSRESPDCVLLDMNMPHYDGRWTIEKLRAHPRHQNLDVIAVSGMHPEECGVDVGPAGVNRWFRKPLDPEALMVEIEKREQDLSRSLSQL